MDAYIKLPLDNVSSFSHKKKSPHYDFSVLEDFLDVTVEEVPGEDGAAGLAKLSNGRVQCLQCGKELASLRSGNRHFALAHQVNTPAQCQICKQSFKNQLYRDDHYRKTHKLSATVMKNTVKPPDQASWNM